MTTDRPKVSIARAQDYDPIQIYDAIEYSVRLIGGLEKIVKPNDRVFVKINHLSPPTPPERGIVTHPVFVEAVLKLLKDFRANITVGDDIDPGTEDGFQVSGIRQVCDKAGIRLVNLREAGFIETECNGLLLDKVYISIIALDADVMINLPKFKTHSLTVFTGGVKNMYGTIPQGLRTRFHYEYLKREDFSQLLVDIFSAVKPHLTIMDGIMAMEGEGPASGKLVKLGVILAGHDAVALDAVATKIIGLEPLRIYTTRYSDERHLGVGNLQNIDVVGEKLGDVSVPGFRPPANYTNIILRRTPELLSGILQEQMTIRPHVIERNCTGCLECLKVCPTSAIAERGEIVRIHQNICIQCMCCHEVCRFNAILPRRPVIGRAISSLATTLRNVTASSH